jgi:hypothetical protein
MNVSDMILYIYDCYNYCISVVEGVSEPVYEEYGNDLRNYYVEFVHYVVRNLETLYNNGKIKRVHADIELANIDRNKRQRHNLDGFIVSDGDDDDDDNDDDDNKDNNNDGDIINAEDDESENNDDNKEYNTDSGEEHDNDDVNVNEDGEHAKGGVDNSNLHVESGDGVPSSTVAIQKVSKSAKVYCAIDLE